MSVTARSFNRYRADLPVVRRGFRPGDSADLQSGDHETSQMRHCGHIFKLQHAESSARDDSGYYRRSPTSVQGSLDQIRL